MQQLACSDDRAERGRDVLLEIGRAQSEHDKGR